MKNIRSAFIFSMFLTVSIYIGNFIPISLFLLYNFAQPSNENVNIITRSLDVMNDFAVPSFEF